MRIGSAGRPIRPGGSGRRRWQGDADLAEAGGEIADGGQSPSVTKLEVEDKEGEIAHRTVSSLRESLGWPAGALDRPSVTELQTPHAQFGEQAVSLSDAPVAGPRQRAKCAMTVVLGRPATLTAARAEHLPIRSSPGPVASRAGPRYLKICWRSAPTTGHHDDTDEHDVG